MQTRVAAAFTALRDRLDESALRAALQRGTVAVLDAIPWDTVLAARLLGDAMRVFRDTYEAAGDAAAAKVKRMVIGKADDYEAQVESFAFDVLNDRGLKFLQQHAARRVVEITDSTRDALRQLLAEMHNAGVPVTAQVARIKQLVGLTSQQVRTVENLRAELVDRGEAPVRVERLVASKTKELHRLRALTVARTEIAACMSAGQRESWQQMVDDQIFAKDEASRVWLTSQDEVQCDVCSPMDGQERGLDEEFETGDGELILDPPVHPNCVPRDSYITAADGIAASSERWYDGDMVVIRTASGKRLACTPNHPVLTDLGWMPARLLHVGHNVISSRLGDRRSLRHLNHQDVPPLIHQITDTLRVSLGALAVGVPISAKDFHGDGINGQVAVVRTDRLLRRNRHPARAKKLCKRHLGATNMNLLPFARLRHTDALIQRATAATHRIMGGAGVSAALLWGHSGHPQDLGFVGIAKRDAAFFQSLPQGDAVSVQLARQLQQGFAGEVFRDKVVNVDVHSFRGHVYNLQTKDSYYIAQGIVTHNCRCDVALRINEQQQAA